MFRNMKLTLGAAALSLASTSHAATTGGAVDSVLAQGAGILLALLVAYFFPLVIAIARKHNNKLAISMLNLFLGWTFLGWIGALIWACTSNRAKA
jgi:hypothetical protein